MRKKILTSSAKYWQKKYVSSKKKFCVPLIQVFWPPVPIGLAQMSMHRKTWPLSLILPSCRNQKLKTTKTTAETAKQLNHCKKCQRDLKTANMRGNSPIWQHCFSTFLVHRHLCQLAQEHFDPLPGKKAKCLYCKKDFMVKNWWTKGLWDHLSSKHSAALAKAKKEDLSIKKAKIIASDQKSKIY
uniref:BED-type domain-containing protein n=1 Tax=Romanomermis culicivorax TaxID=13658 RepID=A0A915IB55_ROMCU